MDARFAAATLSRGVAMKPMRNAIAAVVLATASSGDTASVKKREQRQQHRIERGVESGKLTPKETERLENQQQIIEQEREQAWQDGKMSRRERQDIRHDQNRLSHNIHRKKHNQKRVK